VAQLYAISPPKIELDAFLLKLDAALARLKPALFQLRLKDVSDDVILAAARATLPICHKHGVKFIMNDSIDLALAAKADGVHLGMEDFAASGKQVTDIKALGLHVGLSCYNNLDYALEQGKAGADLVCFGAFYPTTTTKPKAQAELKTLVSFKEQNKNAAKVAVIGGINFENKQPLDAAGADYICMVSAIWS
jgi:thiamine-phosphate pyrophosphorylase